MRRRLRRAPLAARITLSNLLQTAVTAIVALAAAVATIVATGAADDWQRSVREELKRSAALLEDVRYVYGDEAPLGLDLALAEARGRESPAGEAEVEREAVFAMRGANSLNGLIRPRYRRPGRGYDVPRRLGDVRRASPRLAAIDPDATESAGDRRARRSVLILLATVPLVVLYALVDSALRIRSGRRSARRGDRPEEVGLVPRPWSARGTRRFSASVGFAGWLVVALLPTLQLQLENSEERADARAARQAAQVSTALGASGMVASFRADADRAVGWLAVRAVAREIAARDTGDRGLAANAEVDARAGERGRAIAAAMSRPPRASDGVDDVTRAAVNSTLPSARALQRKQNREATAAQHAGERSTRVTLALLLAGLSVSLAALALVERVKRKEVIEMAAASVLGMSLLAVASLPLV